MHLLIAFPAGYCILLSPSLSTISLTLCTPRPPTRVGGSSELIREELYSIGNRFTVNCPGDFLQFCLSTHCREIHTSTYVGNMSSLSDQFKFICFAADARVVNITYILPEYQPIRLVRPQIKHLRPQPLDEVVIPCEATGYPLPNVTFWKWDTLQEEFILLPREKQNFRIHSPSNISYVIPKYYPFLDHPGRYLCRAENVWGQRNVTVYVHEEQEAEPDGCGATSAPSVTPPTSVRNGKLHCLSQVSYVLVSHTHTHTHARTHTRMHTHGSHVI